MFSGVAVSGAGDGSVSVVSGCVAAGAVAEGSGVVIALSAGVLLGVVGSDTPDGLLPGEVYIKTDSAAITIKNNGAVNITGTVNITGSLTVNGTSVG